MERTRKTGHHGRPSAAEWFRLARPFSLTASAVPVLLGGALAHEDGSFSWAPFLAMLLASLLIQAATNMFNEFYDEKRGLDTAEAVGIAGSIVQGRVHARTVLLGALFCYTVALFLGLYLVYVGGWPILLLGCLSALGGYLYSAGPRPIAYTALSEAAVFLFMGVLIVVISYAVQTASSFPAHVPLAALPVGGLVAAILLANNIRDMESDRRGGRRTLPIVLGRRGGILIYRALLAEAYVSALILVMAGTIPAACLVALLSLPLARALWRGIASSTEPARLDAVVKRTAGLHLVFGVLYSLGVLLG
ncbi:1,4-dihydroxy-2-naphthoate octaprenyltransferase [Rubrobacter xylanophilus DSM 9941]|uniref:1,4-dihydroxy-2-naphthoate polyprenyltransferase n=1 Tax=Rubrobacter xylanophilus TaxID=49319 RepID=UPI001C63C64D|nr:1,4-dihydroxy-2-naphthoate polyprenyltransferase [Rubrobacter xylanophilus]QYJ15103.1 1,4-dihydroxy-2-naphthoate octaprenyltransferase [Rubrobacter xylanophilus DSM 9941]